MIRKFLIGVLGLLMLALVIVHLIIKLQIVGMPGSSFQGPPPVADAALLERAARMQAQVEALAFDRSIYNPDGLEKASRLVESAFREMGLNPSRQAYLLDGAKIRQTIADRSAVGIRHARYDIEDQKVTNLWVRIPGQGNPGQLLVVGAHYDTVSGSPGANDNASGIACLMEIARQFLAEAPQVSVILAAFTCEEHPASVAATEGSGRFAEWLLQDRERQGKLPPFGMLSLETLGNFSEEPGSQQHPFPLQFYFPDKGNFVAFVGDYNSRQFITSIVGGFREVAAVPSEGLSIPPALVADILRSDHSAFIKRGVPGLMVTDTANFRVPNPYHTPQDTPEKIDYITLARVAEGLAHSIRQIVPPEPASPHGGDEGIGLGN